MNFLKRPATLFLITISSLLNACIATGSLSSTQSPADVRDSIAVETQSLDTIIETAFSQIKSDADKSKLLPAETARLYALTAIALQESESIAKSGQGIRLTRPLKQTVSAPELMTETAYLVRARALGQPLPQATALSHYIAAQTHWLFTQESRAASAMLNTNTITGENEANWTPPPALEQPPELPPIEMAPPFILHSLDQFGSTTALEQANSADSHTLDWTQIALTALASQNVQTDTRLRAMSALSLSMYDAAIAAQSSGLSAQDTLDSAAAYVIFKTDGPIGGELSSQELLNSNSDTHLLGRNVARYVLRALK